MDIESQAIRISHEGLYGQRVTTCAFAPEAIDLGLTVMAEERADMIKASLFYLREMLGLGDDFCGELRINYHRGAPSAKVKKIETITSK